MDYIDTYSYHYNNTRAILKRLLISYFKKTSSETRLFGFVFNQINLNLQNYSKTNYIEKFNKYEKNAYENFNNRYGFYSGQELEIIKSVLEREVKLVFLGECYKTYASLIREIAINNAILNVKSHLNSYYDYYELVYKLNKYDYIYLIPFEGYVYENSEEFKKMLKIKKKLDLKTSDRLKKHQEKESSQDSRFLIGDKRKVSNSKRNNDSLNIVESFDEDERMLIANVFHTSLVQSKLKNLHLTSFLKITKIIGFYKDDSIFLGKAQGSTVYSKANKGLDYYTSDTSKIKLLDSTISKLDNLNLKDISYVLKSLRFKINKSIR
jgi:hypothetical protein